MHVLQMVKVQLLIYFLYSLEMHLGSFYSTDKEIEKKYFTKQAQLMYSPGPTLLPLNLQVSCSSPLNERFKCSETYSLWDEQLTAGRKQREHLL